MGNRNGKASHQKEESPIFSTLIIKEIERAYDNKMYVWNADGSVGQIIAFDGMNDSAFSDKEYRDVYDSITQTVSRSVSDQLTVGFYQVRNCDIKVDFEALPLNCPPQLNERVKFLGKLVKNNEIFQNKFYLSINSRPNKYSQNMVQRVKGTYQALKSIFTNEEETIVLNNKYQNIKDRIKEVSRTATRFNSLLNNKGVNARVLDSKEEYISVYRSIFAPFKSTIKDMEIDSSKESTRKELFSGVQCVKKNNFFILDNYFHRLYELDRIPARAVVPENQIANLVDAPFEHVYGVVFKTLNNKTSNQRLQKVVETANRDLNMATDNKGNVQDIALVEDYKRFSDAREHVATESANVSEFASFLVYRKKMKDVARHLKTQNMDIEEFILDLDEELNQNIFGGLGQSEWIAPTKGHWVGFCDYAPGMANVSANRFKTLLDIPSNIAYLLPFFARHRKDLKYYGINHLFTDSLGIETFSIFDPTLPSWGYLISGDMGSGKSVTLNLLLSMAYSSLMVSGNSPLLRIVDFGGITSSYFKFLKVIKGESLKFNKPKKPNIQVLELNPEVSYPNNKKIEVLTELLRGHLSELSDRDIIDRINIYYEELMSSDEALTEKLRSKKFKKTLGLNYEDFKDDFKLKPGECKPNPDKLMVTMGILEVMLSNDPKNLESFSTDFNRDDVSSFLDITYERITDRYPRMSDLVETIKEYNQNANNSMLGTMIRRLTRFTINGQYKMFDRETDVDLDQDVILFDLFGLDSDPHLKTIYTSLIIDLIGRDMYEKQDRVRVCVLDEAWAALSTKALRRFVVQFMRLSRKYKFAPMLASQLPTDYFLEDKEDGDLIVAQATNYIFCGITAQQVIDQTKYLYSLDDASAREIPKLGVKTTGGTPSAPVYSRFLHIQKSKNGIRKNICRSLLSPFEYQLYSSSKADNAIFKYYMNELEMDATSICYLLADNKHIGDQKLIEYLKAGDHAEALEIVDR